MVTPGTTAPGKRNKETFTSRGVIKSLWFSMERLLIRELNEGYFVQMRAGCLTTATVHLSAMLGAQAFVAVDMSCAETC